MHNGTGQGLCRVGLAGFAFSGLRVDSSLRCIEGSDAGLNMKGGGVSDLGVPSGTAEICNCITMLAEINHNPALLIGTGYFIIIGSVCHYIWA